MGSTENYDAVILDLGLPEIDGLTVLDPILEHLLGQRTGTTRGSH